MKKLLFLILLTLFQLSANAETYNVVIDGIKYELTYISKGGSVYANAEVQSNSYSGDIVIPVTVTYNGAKYDVSSIGDNAFFGCSSLTSIIIPESVTNIGEDAFCGCSSLTSITVPNSVTNIGRAAFENCSCLNSVIIGNGVTSISYLTFYNCNALTSVTIPNSVTSIGGSAFSGCSSLSSITIGNSVASIERHAFSGCSKLKSIHICDLATWCKILFYDYEREFGHYEYYYCDLPAGYRIYINNEEVKDLVIPNSVTTIKRYAFCGCSSLTSVTIPNSVTSIESYAFEGCTGLTSVTIPNSVTSLGGFSGCSSLTSVTIPNSVTNIESDAFSGCTSLTSVTIPNSVTNIGGGAFSSCTGLTSVTIPNSVTYIESKAFSKCIGLSEASIGSGYIGENSFEGCSSLTSLTIGNGVKSIGQSAFRGCSSLTSVSIGTGIKTIYERAFASCSELTDVYCYAENVPNTSGDAFKDSYIEYATLHVPDVSINLYKQASPWNKFKEIVPSTVNRYILTYMVDDEVYKTYEMDYGTPITPELEPTKEGYIFSGWSEIPETMPAQDVNVYGTLSVNKYKLTFIVDDVEYASYNIDYGSATRIPENNPQKENCEFISWSEIPETMPARNITSTASFKKVSTDIDGVKYKFVGEEAYVIGNNKSGNVKVLSSFEEDGKTYTVTVIDKNAFRNNTNITAVEVPNTIVAINDDAFFGCKNIATITLPSTITNIGVRAFADIDKLNEVICHAQTMPTADRTTFENSYIDYAILQVPYPSLDTYKNTNPWSGFKQIVAIPGTQTSTTEKCATPSIFIYYGNKIQLSCSTENVTFHYNITRSGTIGADEELPLSSTYTLTVYASKEGCKDSDINSVDIPLYGGIVGDVNNDGAVNVADIAAIINIMSKK